jgi:serine protease AprX
MSTRGITWDFAAGPTERWRRSVGATALFAVMSAAVAASGIAVAVHRHLIQMPVGVGANPWFADPYSSPTGPTLPDMASIEQVINQPQALAENANGHGVDVAVLDSGVTPVAGLNGTNSNGSAKLVYGPDLSFDSQDPTRAFVDGYGHGTAIASIIAGNDGVPGGFKGVAPQARIVSVKVGASNGAVDVSQIIAGINWVTQHAQDPGFNIRVLNISLGTDSTQSYIMDPIAHAAEVAWRHGIVVVAAVGNDGTANRTVADPAIDPFVLAVGSSDPQGTLGISDDVVSSFSSRGSSLRHADLVAPGSYIVGLRDPGSTLDTTYPAARVGDRFFRGSGTSQATAIVSGAVADILSVRPNLSPDRVKRALKKTAASIATANPNFVGAGLLDVGAATDSGVDASFAQNFTVGTGGGSLEASRGSSHVSINGVLLTGEFDIFGNPWNDATMGALEEASATWSGGTFNSATWSGATWSSATWSGATWSGATWSGATWSSATWSSATWSSATWSSATWSSATWSSATWSSATWSSATWSGATWSGAGWE